MSFGLCLFHSVKFIPVIINATDNYTTTRRERAAGCIHKGQGRDERARAKKMRIVSVMGIKGDFGSEPQVKNVDKLYSVFFLHNKNVAP